MADTKISSATATTTIPATASLPVALVGDTTARRVTWATVRAGMFNVKDYGAVGDGVADDTAAIQAAITAAAASGVVFCPPGTYALGSSLTIPATGLHLCGTGPSTILSYSGSDYAIKTGSAFTGNDSFNRLRLEHFQLVGTSAALGGFSSEPITSGYVAGGLFLDVVFRDFTGSGAYGFRAKKMYNATLLNCQFYNNHSHVRLGTEAIGIGLTGCWLDTFTNYGLHIAASTSFFSYMQGGFIQSPGSTPTSQKGLWVEAGSIRMLGVAFEDCYQHFDIDASNTRLEDCVLADLATVNSTIADDCYVVLSGLRGNVLNVIEAGRGTMWVNCQLTITPPTQTSGEITHPATVLNYTPATPASLNGFIQSGRYCTGPITLIFGNGNTTVVHGASSTVDGYLLLKGAIDWTPSAGDALTLISSGGDGPFIELGRYP